MMSQNRVIIFGNEAAKAGVGKALDYFVRNSDNRATVYAAVAEDTAGQILRAEMGQRVIPAKELSNVLSSSKYNSVTAERAFYQFVNGVTDKTSSAFLPIIAIEQNEKTTMVARTAERILQGQWSGELRCLTAIRWKTFCRRAMFRHF